MTHPRAKLRTSDYKEAARLIAIGRYNEADAAFDREAYRAQWKLPLLVTFGFIHRFSVREFRIVQGDRLMALIASEIWLYNMSRSLAREQELGDEVQNATEDRFGKCNTFSIAQYLGISNATCRRKVKKLIDMGWVAVDAKKQLYTTQACEDAFNDGSNEETLADFISTARTLFRMLDLQIGRAKGVR